MSSESDSTTRHIGNVKWFNNKAGFGFITMGENTDTPKDIFAHYSNINVKNLTIYGNQNSNGNILTLLFSFDGTNFYKSQYSYTFGASVSGNFGFNVQCCPKYVCIQSANLCTLTLFVDYC